VLQGVETLSLTQANAFECGKFHFQKCFVDGDSFPPAFWAQTGNKAMQVQIDTSVDGATFTTPETGSMVGNVDSHTWDPLANTIQVAGRDLAAQMIDTRVVSTYRNQTASEIAAALAAKYGLQTSITATTAPVGRNYDADYDQTQAGDFSQASNEWDLLCRLGSQAGITPYIMGTTLYFNPPNSNPPVFPITMSRNATGQIVSNVPGLTLTRHLTVARDVIVTVRSWHSRKKGTFTATYRVKSKAAQIPGQPAIPATPYLVVIPNLTQAQCQQQAQKIALEISQHERSVTIEAASLVQLTPAHVVRISGTATDYDMTYYPQQVTTEISFQAGAKTTIQARYCSAATLYDDDTGQAEQDIGEDA
jgi:phage protein D